VDNLSDTRGTHGGILFFKLLARFGGMGAALWAVRPISFFYALFDRAAAARSRDYLAMRFPESVGGKRKMFMHRWRLFRTQGQLLLLSRVPGALKFNASAHADFRNLVASGRGRLVVVTSHFGAWQAAMPLMHSAKTKVGVLERPDASLQMNKKDQLANGNGMVGAIGNTNFMGGMIEAANLLEADGVVVIMGDRSDGGRDLKLEFLGRKCDFPASPWYLAARCGAAVVVAFAVADIENRELKISCFELPPPEFSGKRPSLEELRRYAQKYICELEKFALYYPYQLFFVGKES